MEKITSNEIRKYTPKKPLITLGKTIKKNKKPTIIMHEIMRRMLNSANSLPFLSNVDNSVYETIKLVTSRKKLWFVKEHEVAKITSCCNNCSFLFSTNDSNIHNCTNHSLTLFQDPTKRLPVSLTTLYCNDCTSYFCSRSRIWRKIRPESYSILLKFLLEKLSFDFRRLKLLLIDAWFVQPEEEDNNNSTTIPVVIKVEFEASDGSKQVKIHNVVFNRAYVNCPACSALVDETKMSSILQLRKYTCDQRLSLRSLIYSIFSNPPTDFNIKKMKRHEYGMDFFFANHKDATKLYNFICTQVPVKRDELQKKFVFCSISKNSGVPILLNGISALVCPISWGDLVRVPSEIAFSWELFPQMRLPLAFCTTISNTITLLDPLTGRECEMNGEYYWWAPFKPVKTSKELVEFRVLDVEIVSDQSVYWMANVRVARVSDIWKNDTEFMVKTHLGKELKRGDHVLGYDLCGVKLTDIEIDYCMEMPSVVLIKKKYEAAKLPSKVTKKRKIVSPEYKKFLADLEKNPEALFNLSLNDGNQEQKQNSGDQNAVLELDALLANLDLSDQ